MHPENDSVTVDQIICQPNYWQRQRVGNAGMIGGLLVSAVAAVDGVMIAGRTIIGELQLPVTETLACGAGYLAGITAIVLSTAFRADADSKLYNMRAHLESLSDQLGGARKLDET